MDSMITKIVNASEKYVLLYIHVPLTLISMLVNDDIEEIVQRGEERTAQPNSRYEGLKLVDFKSDASAQRWEGRGSQDRSDL